MIVGPKLSSFSNKFCLDLFVQKDNDGIIKIKNKSVEVKVWGFTSNVEFIRVIIPSELMYESRERTCVTPCRSMPKRLIVQFPVDREFVKPFEIKS